MLRPGGQAMVMVYNRHSYRQAVMLPVMMMKQGVVARPRRGGPSSCAPTYDANADGAPRPRPSSRSPPTSAACSPGSREVHIRRENFDDFVLACGDAHFIIPRAAFLNNVARIAGSGPVRHRDEVSPTVVPGILVVYHRPDYKLTPRPFADAATVREHIHSFRAHSRVSGLGAEHRPRLSRAACARSTPR